MVTGNGTVKAWVYYKTNANASVFLSVWRRSQLGPETDNYFRLVGKNRVPPGSRGRRIFRVKPKYRIKVQAGDFIGYHYSIHDKSGAIAVVNDSHVPGPEHLTWEYLAASQKKPYQDTLTAGLFDENFLPQTNILFNTNDRRIVRQRNAVAALVQYPPESEERHLSDSVMKIRGESLNRKLCWVL